MKLGEVVVIYMYYNFTKFCQNQMKNKKVLLIAHFSVHNFKVSVELWKLYIALLSSVQVSSIKRPGNFADTDNEVCRSRPNKAFLYLAVVSFDENGCLNYTLGSLVKLT